MMIMTAVLAPAWGGEELEFNYESLAPNHPAVRRKHHSPRLRLVPGLGAETVGVPVLSWWRIAGSVGVFILALVAAVTLGALVGISLDPSFGLVPVDYFSYTVLPGDNLWSLAAANVTAVPPGEAVAQIMKINHLDAASVLQTGDQLLIPIY
ncbi:LysM peptidoglycan-binding domain-containing protein [Mobiluncus mulieris]|uniref:LysM peptidoglycan-binding domain-containing protein n=2 Tax=Mobiluncus mulieris TaxID=2052 RepID=A0ABD4TXQ9_9ACTO|nr:LysM peptidoglycan-binding domain-containing protein [Mobiluncus mulieris]MCU9968733.1 LysM peptidoglycan-binding domain-containing protein [Mobiluncus mulieris]MCU9973219.1 LysM peptidoglycan-binding domain-containing protein [Mobiluncus mulieris]MCV0008783.1 LysM peptidoglycan-binding domain-containing protein [Mobiluncus mulieris]NMW74113.1 LysM peptidoglycan-binding domain-containing protein [Mobiluncus mulieris]NMX00732.1 LysM peptidoglycan-binding domain-containing protein [Mobiluncus